MIGNMRSLRNKVDKLACMCKLDYTYHEASMLCLTENWLNESDPASAYELDNFTMVQADRTTDSGKSIGGGLCVLHK